MKSVLMVTHNIEEAVLMCDRILVFSSNPGRVAQELKVPFPHPRNRHDFAFRKFVDDIYALMTRRATSVPAPSTEGTAEAPAVETVHALYPVSTNLMAGLIETLAGEPYRGRADLPPLARPCNWNWMICCRWGRLWLCCTSRSWRKGTSS